MLENFLICVYTGKLWVEVSVCMCSCWEVVPHGLQGMGSVGFKGPWGLFCPCGAGSCCTVGRWQHGWLCTVYYKAGWMTPGWRRGLSLLLLTTFPVQGMARPGVRAGWGGLCPRVSFLCVCAGDWVDWGHKVSLPDTNTMQVSFRPSKSSETASPTASPAQFRRAGEAPIWTRLSAAGQEGRGSPD